MKHFANWTSSLEQTTFSIRVTYEVIGHIESAPLVYSYYVSNLGATTRYKYFLNLSIGCTALYVYEPDTLGAFVSLLIPEVSFYPYVSNLRATLWLLTSSRYSTPDLICYIGQWGAFDNWNPFYVSFYVSPVK